MCYSPYFSHPFMHYANFAADYCWDSICPDLVWVLVFAHLWKILALLVMLRLLMFLFERWISDCWTWLRIDPPTSNSNSFLVSIPNYYSLAKAKQPLPIYFSASLGYCRRAKAPASWNFNSEFCGHPSMSWSLSDPRTGWVTFSQLCLTRRGFHPSNWFSDGV